MNTIIDSYFFQHKELSDYLLNNGELTLKIDADRRFAKILILASASYFEERIISAISTYSDTVLSNNEKIMALLKIKAFDRQYHTLFDWKENNANKFFSFFGDSVKKTHKDDIKRDDALKTYEQSFMTLGRMRNVLVHSNFAIFPIDETYEEIYELFHFALKFVSYIETIFSIEQCQYHHAS